MVDTTHDRDTIFALSSGSQRAAVAVIRVSGPQAGLALERLAGRLPKPRYAAMRVLREFPGGPVLDQALVLWLPGPNSETGEDVAELQVHGSRAVVAAVYRVLGAMAGLRLAEPGEFARRAFEAGKLDLTAAEGIADLVDAETEAQRRQALAQVTGQLAGLYDGWRRQIIDAMALAEAAIDFSDEGDVGAKAMDGALEAARRLRGDISRHVEGASRGEIVRCGFRVVLAGAPNVGKSSLLNALARRDVAIVSEEAGTTRDVVEARLDLGGMVVLVSDTAGIRETEGVVEREGIRRTLERARESDLVVWVREASAGGGLSHTVEPEEVARAKAAGRALTAVNKIDLLPGAAVEPGEIAISAKTGVGLDALTAELARRAALGGGVGAGEDCGLVPTSERHRIHLGQALAALDAFIGSSWRQAELGAEDLRRAADALGRLTGRVDPEDVLSAIFGRFCIGK